MSLPILALIGFLMFVIYLAFPLSMEHALPHPIPMPDVPEELVKLPAQAQIKCQDPENSGRAADSNEDSIRVWSYPGVLPPRPDDSAYCASVADYGLEQGQIARCSEIQIIDFAWSEFDGEFLVWLKWQIPRGHRGGFKWACWNFADRTKWTDSAEGRRQRGRVHPFGAFRTSCWIALRLCDGSGFNCVCEHPKTNGASCFSFAALSGCLICSHPAELVGLQLVDLACSSGVATASATADHGAECPAGETMGMERSRSTMANRTRQAGSDPILFRNGLSACCRPRLRAGFRHQDRRSFFRRV